jgi:hypothetical protein
MGGLILGIVSLGHFGARGWRPRLLPHGYKRHFGELKLDRLTAIVHPENAASIRVVQKLGFLEERREVIMGMESIVYCLTPRRQGDQLDHY